jgi:hypothetical protein
MRRASRGYDVLHGWRRDEKAHCSLHRSAIGSHGWIRYGEADKATFRKSLDGGNTRGSCAGVGLNHCSRMGNRNRNWHILSARSDRRGLLCDLARQLVAALCSLLSCSDLKLQG